MKEISIIFLIVFALVAPMHAHDGVNTDSASVELREILVKANQPATKLVGNTLVSTIAGSRLQNLGTCLDVLAQLPLITISDGIVSVVGKGTPEVYIDGRPMRDGEELVQLQSSDIRKVELLLAPGAMYASETNAVLKITTKKIFLDGLSLLDRAELIARRKFSANDYLDISYRSGRFDYFASATIARNNSLIKGTTTNSLLYIGVPTIVGSTQHNSYPSSNMPVKAGLNYADESLSFGAYYRYNREHGKINNHGAEWLNDESPILRNIDNDTRANNHLVSAYFDRTFNGKYTLHFDGNFRSSLTKTDNITSYPTSEDPAIVSDDRRNSILWAGKLYFGMPLWRGSLTCGLQDSYTHTTLDYHMLNDGVSQYIPSSLTDTRQISAAAYASWDRSFGNINLSAGFRYEYVDFEYSVNDKIDSELSRKNHLLTPDLSLSYTFNDYSQASLSYRLATVRPPYSRLTSSLSYVGRHEIEGGNPALRDERMHNIQLFGMWKDFMLQADYTRSLDSYAFVKKIYPAIDLQLIMQPININVSAINLYLIWSRSIRAWTPNITVGMYRQWLEIDGTHYNRPIFSYYFDNTISLPKGFMATLNATGQTSGDMHTNRFGTTWFSLDASIGKSFFNKALQVNITATDIFNTACNYWTMNTFGVQVDKQQSYDRRGVSLAVTYRFNPRKSNYKGKNASDAEINRL